MTQFVFMHCMSSAAWLFALNGYANITSALTLKCTKIIYTLYLNECKSLSLAIILFGCPAAPSAQHLSATAKLNGLEVKCSSDTYCNVAIQVNGAVQSVAAYTTFNGLTSNMMYPICASAINRCGDYTETSVSHWTCKALWMIGTKSSWCIVTVPDAPPASTIGVLRLLINESATQLNITWSHIVR